MRELDCVTWVSNPLVWAPSTSEARALTSGPSASPEWWSNDRVFTMRWWKKVLVMNAFKQGQVHEQQPAGCFILNNWSVCPLTSEDQNWWSVDVSKFHCTTYMHDVSMCIFFNLQTKHCVTLAQHTTSSRFFFHLQTKYRMTLAWHTIISTLSPFCSGSALWKYFRKANSIRAPSWKNCWKKKKWKPG